jgi:hypothetical protein
MNRRMTLYALVAFSIGVIGLPSPVTAEKLHFLPIHGTEESHCLADLLQESRWDGSPEISEMMATAIVAEVHLSGDRRKAYFYVFEGPGWCGTIGCPLLIGEVRSSGGCRLLYDGSGFANALGDAGLRPAMEVLRARDHGYRRLYTPCDTRFDGKQYQKLHAECSRIDVQR